MNLALIDVWAMIDVVVDNFRLKQSPKSIQYRRSNSPRPRQNNEIAETSGVRAEEKQNDNCHAGSVHRTKSGFKFKVRTDCES